MWLKSIDEITKYLPKDGLFHDVHIIGDNIYVDGEHQNPYLRGSIKGMIIKDRALTAKEIKQLADNQRMEQTGKSSGENE